MGLTVIATRQFVANTIGIILFDMAQMHSNVLLVKQRTERLEITWALIKSTVNTTLQIGQSIVTQRFAIQLGMSGPVGLHTVTFILIGRSHSVVTHQIIVDMFDDTPLSVLPYRMSVLVINHSDVIMNLATFAICMRCYGHSGTGVERMR